MKELINQKENVAQECTSYLKRSQEFGKECLIKTEADHPAVANHLPVRTQLGEEESDVET